MAEEDDSSVKEIPVLNEEFTASVQCNPNARYDEKIRDVVINKENDFEECAGIGKSIIDSIKYSLHASSASFNRTKYAAALEDPYAKAYRYLEENQVLSMLEDLITHTVFHQPRKPFPFMTEVVEHFYDDISYVGRKE